VEDNFASEIALALDEDAENVKLTLAFLQRHISPMVGCLRCVRLCGLREMISEKRQRRRKWNALKN
jgi:hypothetical protein